MCRIKIITTYNGSNMMTFIEKVPDYYVSATL